MPPGIFARLSQAIQRGVLVSRSHAYSRGPTWIVLIAAGSLCAATVDPLPPISGELSGQFAALKLAGAPPLKWKLSLAPGENAGSRLAGLEIDGTGTTLRGQARFDGWNSAHWRVDEGRIELASWFPVIAPKLGAAVANLTLQGLATFTGEGTLRGSDLRGRMEFSIRDGTIRDVAAGWVVEGMSLRGRLAQIPELASDGRVTLTFREASGYGVTAGNARIEFSIDAHRRINVQQAVMNLMGGRAEFAPFVFDPEKPEVRTNVEFDHVELGRFAKLLPSVLADAEGPVSGRVQISWSAATGLQSASGTLYAQKEAAPTIRLAPSPGFLTSRLPENVRERIDLLPKWLGPIRNLFRPVNPAYTTLHAIEMGEAPLELTTVAVNVNTAGDAAGRTARVVVLAKPAARDSAVESVRFEINVTGPLADLVKIGMEGRLKVRAR